MGGVDTIHRQSHSEEDTDTHLQSPATSVSRRGQRVRIESVAHLGSTTRAPNRKETKQRKRNYVNSSQDESDSTDTASPRPLHVEATGPHQPGKTTTSVARDVFDGFAAAVGLISRPAFSTMLGIVMASFLFPWIPLQIVYVTRPVCSVPVISPMVPFCYLDVFKHQINSSGGQLVRRADYPRLVALQTKAFGRLIEEDVRNKGLALEVNKAEVAGHNLITLVRASGLEGKDQIAERLGQFAADARGAGYSLRSIGVKIQGAVDS